MKVGLTKDEIKFLISRIEPASTFAITHLKVNKDKLIKKLKKEIK